MSYMKKDLAQLLDAPPSSTSFLCRRLGVEPDCADGTYSYAGAAGLLAAEELRGRGLSFELAGAAGRALREEVGELIGDPARQSWLLLEDGESPACEIAPDAAALLDRVKQDHIALKARPLASRSMRAIRDAKEARRAVTN